MIDNIRNTQNSNIAVLIASFNRKMQTINCLNSLFKCNCDVDVFLVDDNSTDGTVEEVLLQFPAVNIILGSGDLFWNRAMNLAWQHASSFDYGFYIWLNNDVVLFRDALSELFESLRLCDDYGIISGVVVDSKNQIIYGGTDLNRKLINPKGSITNICNLNGNVVLIPKSVFTVLGNLDPYFIHDFGDVDYGLRAIKSNIPVVTTRHAVAVGERNSFCRVRLNNSTLLTRFKRLYSPLGSNPKTQFYFQKKHFGLLKAVLFFLFLCFLNVIPDKLNLLLFGKKYT